MHSSAHKIKNASIMFIDVHFASAQLPWLKSTRMDFSQSYTGLASPRAQILTTVHTYCLGGFDGGGRVLDSPGLSVSVTVGDRAGTGGGGALSYLYSSLGTSFMSSSTGS